MELHSDFKTPTDLTAAARAGMAETNDAFPLSQYLPILETESETFEYDIEQKKVIDGADFLSFDSETRYGRDTGTSAKTGRLLPLGRKKLARETDLRYVTDKGALFENHAIQLGQDAAKTLELARAKVLTTGKFTWSNDELNIEVDFGRPTGNTVTLDAPKRWDHQTTNAYDADPIADILGWIEKFPEITVYLVPKSIIALLAVNPKVIGEAVGRGDNLPGRIGFGDVIATFAKYGVQLIDSTTPYSELTVGGQLVDFTNPLPANTIIGVRPAGVGQTQIGLASETQNPQFGLTAAGPGLIGYAAVNHDPEGFDIVMRGFGMPVLTAARYTATFQVLA